MLASFFGDLRRPPTLTNTEGEDLVLCQARYQVVNLDRVRSALDGRLEAQGDDVWHQWYEKDDRRWIRATVHLEGENLVVAANSVARFDRITELVAAAPRQAAADPDRSDDLRLLLHEMDRHDEASPTGGFSVTRLRALLELQ